EAHLLVMRLHLAYKQPTEALRHYRGMERAFREGLGSEPSAAAQAISRQAQQLAQTSAPVVPTDSTGSAPHLSVPRTESPKAEQIIRRPDENRPRLPVQLTRFFGRRDEIERLVNLLTPGSDA